MKLAELDLPHLPMEDPAFAADPFPHFAAARARHPWLATSSFGYVVTEYSAMRELFGQDDRLRPSLDGIVEQLGVEGTPWGRWATEHLMSVPPEQHRIVRDVFVRSFTPRYANELRPLIRASVNRLLEEWAPKGEFDFEEFASWFPISVMFVTLGAPVERIGDIKADLEAMGLAFSMDKSLVPAMQAAVVRLDRFVQQLIAEPPAMRGSSGICSTP